MSAALATRSSKRCVRSELKHTSNPSLYVIRWIQRLAPEESR